jgi:hypothetical protein
MFLATSGARSDPGDLADLSLPHVVPASLGHLVADKHDQLGTFRPALARALQQHRVGVGEVALEGLFGFRGTGEAGGPGFGQGHDGGPHVGL